MYHEWGDDCGAPHCVKSYFDATMTYKDRQGKKNSQLDKSGMKPANDIIIVTHYKIYKSKHYISPIKYPLGHV